MVGAQSHQGLALLLPCAQQQCPRRIEFGQRGDIDMSFAAFGGGLPFAPRLRDGRGIEAAGEPDAAIFDRNAQSRRNCRCGNGSHDLRATNWAGSPARRQPDLHSTKDVPEMLSAASADASRTKRRLAACTARGRVGHRLRQSAPPSDRRTGVAGLSWAQRMCATPMRDVLTCSGAPDVCPRRSPP